MSVLKVQCPNPDCQASFSVADDGADRCPECDRRYEPYPTLDTAGSSAPEPIGPVSHPSELADGSVFGR